ncbi:unnamed protein product [Closterium sp. NIES-54]
MWMVNIYLADCFATAGTIVVSSLKKDCFPFPLPPSPSLPPSQPSALLSLRPSQILMQLWMVNIYIADGFATAGTIVASSLAGRMAQAQTRGEHAALLADLRLTCWRVLRMGLMTGGRGGKGVGAGEGSRCLKWQGTWRRHAPGGSMQRYWRTSGSPAGACCAWDCAQVREGL